MTRPSLRVKRIYEPAALDDGQRVLVDRLWPRGIARDRAALDLWLPEMGPSTELRKWFGHDDERWVEFSDRYRRELTTNPLLATLIELSNTGPLTLLYGAKNEAHNQAVVLKEVLEESSAHNQGT